MANAASFSCHGNGSNVNTVVGGGEAGLATTIALYRSGLKNATLDHSESLQAAGMVLFLWPNARKILDALGIAALLEGLSILKDDLKAKSEKLHEIRDPRTTCVSGFRSHLGGGKSLGFGSFYAGSENLPFIRLISLLTSLACKDGGLHVVDLLHHTTAWPNLCSHRPDLPDLSKSQVYPKSRQRIGEKMHRLSRGYADPVMQMEYRTIRRPDLEDCIQPDHMEICNDTGSGRAGTQPKREQQVTKSRFQIFIKTPEKKSFLVWVHADSTIMQLKQQIWALNGYLGQIQHLVSGRWSLQDNRTLGSYEISPGDTIVLNLRLKGGAQPQGQPSSSGGDKGKKTTPQHQTKGGHLGLSLMHGWTAWELGLS